MDVIGRGGSIDYRKNANSIRRYCGKELIKFNEFVRSRGICRRATSLWFRFRRCKYRYSILRHTSAGNTQTFMKLPNKWPCNKSRTFRDTSPSEWVHISISAEISALFCQLSSAIKSRISDTSQNTNTDTSSIISVTFISDNIFVLRIHPLQKYKLHTKILQTIQQLSLSLGKRNNYTKVLSILFIKFKQRS